MGYQILDTAWHDDVPPIWALQSWLPDCPQMSKGPLAQARFSLEPTGTSCPNAIEEAPRNGRQNQFVLVNARFGKRASTAGADYSPPPSRLSTADCLQVRDDRLTRDTLVHSNGA